MEKDKCHCPKQTTRRIVCYWPLFFSTIGVPVSLLLRMWAGWAEHINLSERQPPSDWCHPRLNGSVGQAGGQQKRGKSSIELLWHKRVLTKVWDKLWQPVVLVMLHLSTYTLQPYSPTPKLITSGQAFLFIVSGGKYYWISFCQLAVRAYFCAGELAERSNAAVLKTVDCNRSGGSNPSLSAENNYKTRQKPANSTFAGFFVLV